MPLLGDTGIFLENSWVLGAIGAIATAVAVGLRVVWIYVTGKFDDLITWVKPLIQAAFTAHMNLVNTLNGHVEKNSVAMINTDGRLTTMDDKLDHMIDAMYSQTVAAELLAKDDQNILKHLHEVKQHLELAKQTIHTTIQG